MLYVFFAVTVTTVTGSDLPQNCLPQNCLPRGVISNATVSDDTLDHSERGSSSARAHLLHLKRWSTHDEAPIKWLSSKYRKLWELVAVVSGIEPLEWTKLCNYILCNYIHNLNLCCVLHDKEACFSHAVGSIGLSKRVALVSAERCFSHANARAASKNRFDQVRLAKRE